MKHSRPVQLAAIALVIAAYVALRFWRLTDSCLWFDEIFSVHAAEHSWNTLLSFVALDLIHPPLFYILLKLWITTGGDSLLWLRLFPVLFAVVSLIPFVLLIREVKQNRWVELIALFLFAVNGSLIKYSQEVRMYSPLLCLSLFSMWLFARYFVRGKSFIPLVLVNLLLIYTHYFGWFVVLSEIAAILIFQHIKWRRMLLMLAVLFAGFTPWIVAVWSASNSGSDLGQNIGWMMRPKVFDIFQFIFDLVEPVYYQATTAEPSSIYRVSLPILIILVTSAVVCFATWKPTFKVEHRYIKLVALFAAAPIVTAFFMSWLLPYSIWGTRHLIIVFPPFTILAAIVLANVPMRGARVAALTLIILFSGYASVLQAFRPTLQYSWCAWEPLIAQTAAEAPANVYTFEDLVAYNAWFADRSRSNNNVLKVNGIDGIADDKAYFLPRGFNDVVTIDVEDVSDSKIRLAYRAKNFDPNEPPVKNFLNKGYGIIDQRIVPAKGESAILILLENK